VSAQAAARFNPHEVAIAIGVALLAQLLFIATFQLPPPRLVQADISNDNAQPIAVAITPVLKLGTKTPTNVPSQWQRKKAPAPKVEPTPLPSPQAAKTPEAIPTTRVVDASAPSPLASATQPQPTTSSDVPAPSASSAVATASSVEGSEQGAANGTETDPLKARAADMYRAQLAAFIRSRFQIRGKIPFDQLKKLRASAVVNVTGDRKVGSFAIVKPSGDATFDAEVQAALSRVQSSGAELPAPPPLYPELLGQSFPVGFACTVQASCE
jgi:hypothetical protein